MVNCPECGQQVDLDESGRFQTHNINSMQRALCHGSGLKLQWMKNATDGRIRWFGHSWLAPINDDTEHVPTPVGTVCTDCGESIERGDQGIFMVHVDLDEERKPHSEYKPQHRECNLRHVIGGLNHQKGLCHCFGGTEPSDPPDMSRREAARQAVALFERNNQ